MLAGGRCAVEDLQLLGYPTLQLLAGLRKATLERFSSLLFVEAVRTAKIVIEVVTMVKCRIYLSLCCLSF